MTFRPGSYYAIVLLSALFVVRCFVPLICADYFLYLVHAMRASNGVRVVVVEGYVLSNSSRFGSLAAFLPSVRVQS